MNKIITISILMLTLSASLLTSCGNVKVVKRVHKSGYYVDLGFNKHLKKQNQSRNEELVTETEELTQPVVSVIESKPIDLVDSPSEITNEEATDVKTESVHEQKVQKETINLTAFTKVNPMAIGSKIKESRTQFKQSIKSKKAIAASSGGEARSLLWLVIIIVLILWLIGFLAGGLGMGNLINLLLLVALILLILWLLRII